MRRREFIAGLGVAAAWPLVARAQQPVVPVIGFLSGRSFATDAHLVAAFRRGLGENGYTDSQNVAIEFRWADGQFNRLSGMAADLVSRHVAVIFIGGADIEMRALTAAVSMTPIVFAAAGDPVEMGVVVSLNRPGRNATGATLISAELGPKRLQLLHELVAPMTTIALLIDPNDPNAKSTARDVAAAARTLGLQIRVFEVSTEYDFEATFARLVDVHAGAVLLTANALFNNQRARLVALAERFAVPAIYDRREFVDAGGLVSYGASNVDLYRQGGIYAGRILNGAKPADLPVLQPTKFELVINLKTAKALRLTIPETLLATADEVIQ
jgi:putative tryptophan/tyrosine transport system substrate-binding protein